MGGMRWLILLIRWIRRVDAAVNQWERCATLHESLW